MAQRPVHRDVYSDTYSVGGFAAARQYILTFTHVATGHSVSFPATIQELNDAHTAEINEQIFADRMDPLIQQASTDRSISFSFKILNSSIEEARYNEQSINMLMQMMYPKLRQNGEVEAGSYIKVTGLNMIKNTVSDKSVTCLIEQINYSPDIDEGFIAPNPNEIHPIGLTISISAKAIIPKSRTGSENPYPNNYPRYR